jgi:hypothetical protein
MNNNLKLNLNGNDYLFTDGGSVLNAGSGAAAGRWHATSDQPANQNCLLYDLNGIEQPALPANYRFNDANQLVVTVPQAGNAGAGQAAATTFSGCIRTDDSKNIVYDIFDNSGNATGQSVTLYGALRFDTPFRLVIDMPGGIQAMIRANDDQAPVEANQASPSGIGADRLDFKASTVNTFTTPAGPEVRAIPADVGFDGEWRLDSDGLKFACDATGDQASQQVVLGLGGKYKAVAGGLEVAWQSGGQLSAKLVVEGKHTFDGGSASWNVAIGYTQLSGMSPSLSAKSSGTFTHTDPKGNTFTISGALDAEDSDGNKLTLALEIEAAYTFKEGTITFSAVAGFAGSQLTYDLRLGGQLKFLGGNLTFAIDYGSDQSVDLKVDYQGTSDSFLKYFNLKFSRDNNGNIGFGVNFNIAFAFKNGVLVSSPPKLLA